MVGKVGGRGGDLNFFVLNQKPRASKLLIKPRVHQAVVVVPVDKVHLAI